MEQFREGMLEVEGDVVIVEVDRILVINVVVFRVVSVRMVSVINVRMVRMISMEMVDPDVVEVAIREKEMVKEVLYNVTYVLGSILYGDVYC